jgi:hypothetical protein
MSGLPPSATNLTTPYSPVAVYYEQADSVEYIRRDTPAVYRRIDEILTLIFDMRHRDDLIGFRIKGFKNFYLKAIKPSVEPLDSDWLALVSVIERALKFAGDGVFEKREREAAYAKARSLALEDRVKLRDLPKVCA